MQTDYNNFVVAIPVFGNYEVFFSTLTSVLQFTPPEVPIIIADDRYKVPVSVFLEYKDIDKSRILIIEQTENLGFAKNCNHVFNLFPDKNVILVNSDVLVSVGWFEAMIKPLKDYENVATVTAMTNHGGLAKVKIGSEEIPYLPEGPLFVLNEKLNTVNTSIIPRIPVGVGHCILITSEARSIFGHFDEKFSPGYGEEVDFSLRCSERGFHHFLAKTFVSHLGGATFSQNTSKLQDSHEKIIAERYPNYHSVVWDYLETNDQLFFLFYITLNCFRKSRILIDCRLMLENPTGTSRLCFETIKALSLNQRYNFTILVQSHLLMHWESEFKGEFNFISPSELGKHVSSEGKFDLVFRPNQIGSKEDAIFLHEIAHRVILQQLDFISFHNFQYFQNYALYRSYREATEAIFQTADAITFISNHVYELAQVEFRRNNVLDQVIPCGVDHFEEKSDLIRKEKNILMYGANFAHKNWVYAIDIFAEIHNQDPQVVLHLIGPSPTTGSSSISENYILDFLPETSWRRDSWISDANLKELISTASLVLYPTLNEGFGFVPFESAKMGTASLFSKKTSLNNFFANVPYALTFNREEDVRTIIALLNSEELQHNQIDKINEIGADLTWSRVGVSLDKLFSDTIFSYPTLSRRSVANFYQNRSREINSRQFLLERMITFSYKKVPLKFFPIGSKRRKKVVKLVLLFLFR